MILKTRYEEPHYNGRQPTQLNQQFTHLTSEVYEVDIITGHRSVYSGRRNKEPG